MQLQPAHQFIMMGSDGIFDVLSDEEVVTTVQVCRNMLLDALRCSCWSSMTVQQIADHSFAEALATHRSESQACLLLCAVGCPPGPSYSHRLHKVLQ